MFSVVFAPTTQGAKTLSLSITHTSTGSPRTVIITGNGVPVPPVFDLQPSPPPHDFGNVFLSAQSDPIDFVITNTGGSVLTIEPIAIFGNDAHYFTIIGGNTSNINLNANHTFNFSVRFLPTTEGLKDANISIIHNADSSPTFVRLIGTGVRVPPPIFEINPVSHDFGKIRVTTTSEQVFTISNIGESNLMINSISITGVNQNEFAHNSENFPLTIVPNGNQLFNVTFAPISAGSKTAEVIVHHNAEGLFTNVILIGYGDEELFEDDIVGIPNVTALFNNFPNPFNPETTIRFALLENKNVLIEIFNIRGQKLITLINGYMSAGYHQVIWDGRDINNNQVGSGIYFYRMRAGEYQSIRRMILMK